MNQPHPGVLPKIYIVLLNWNGWRDTIACLETVFGNRYPNYQVIVCDNNSQDGSVAHICEWAEGNGEVASWHNLPGVPASNVDKPLPLQLYQRHEAEAGGNGNDDGKLILIQTGDNLGFAGGNNVGVRYALAKNDAEYIWLLNNDTVIHADALLQLYQRMIEDQTIGMCGSTLVYYHTPAKIQAAGGSRFNKWLATSSHLAALQDVNSLPDQQQIEADLDYIVGASLLVSCKLLRDIGLMAEDYFLYFEEIDWATRARGKYRLGYAAQSLVYHKEGGSIGGNNVDLNNKSYTADFYALRNRLRFTRKHFSYCVPGVVLGLMIAAINRAKRGQFERVKMIFSIVFGF